MSQRDDLKPIGTDVHKLVNSIPSELPKPKLEKVKVDEGLNADKFDVSLTLKETIGRWVDSLVSVLTKVSDTVIKSIERIIDIKMETPPKQEVEQTKANEPQPQAQPPKQDKLQAEVSAMLGKKIN